MRSGHDPHDLAPAPCRRKLGAARDRRRRRRRRPPAPSTAGRSPATRRTARSSAARSASATPTRSSACCRPPGARGSRSSGSSSPVARGCRRARAALAGYGRIFRETVALTGVVPQISVVSGASAGGGAYSPALTDLIVMTEDAAMFLTGPGVVREALGEEIDAAGLGGPHVHDRNGVCHLVERDEASRRRAGARAAVVPAVELGPDAAALPPLAPLPVDGGAADPDAVRPGGAAPRLRRPRRAVGDRRRRVAAGAVPALGAQHRHRARADRRPAGRRSSPTSRATWAACSTPRARRRRPGSSRCATRSGCR